jgi:integrase
MAKHAEGWKLRVNPNSGGVQQVRFRHLGRRFERSTGTSDPAKAAVEAARIYSEVVSGRRAVSAPVSTELDVAVSSFLADAEKTDSAEWVKVLTVRFKTHLIPFFGSFERFTPASYADYGRERLGHVSRPSVRAELCALRRFVAWMAEHDVELPAVPALPKHGKAGTRAKNARKRKATIVTEAQAKRILVAMPERSRKSGAWVRPFFTVLWETGLRPITLLRLEAPLHYRKGQKTLFVTREIDKEGFERHVPLSTAARKALDRVSPKSGKLFDAAKASLRHMLEGAVKKAGLTDRDISVYDFRHSRITLGANSGAPIAGIAHLVGHRRISTTALYTQTNEDAAREALAVMGKRKRT